MIIVLCMLPERQTHFLTSIVKYGRYFSLVNSFPGSLQPFTGKKYSYSHSFIYTYL